MAGELRELRPNLKITDADAPARLTEVGIGLAATDPNVPAMVDEFIVAVLCTVQERGVPILNLRKHNGEH